MILGKICLDGGGRSLVRSRVDYYFFHCVILFIVLLDFLEFWARRKPICAYAQRGLSDVVLHFLPFFFFTCLVVNSYDAPAAN